MDYEVTGGWAVVLIVVGALGSLGGLSGIVAVISANAVRRRTDAEAEKARAEADKTDADAAEQITNTALKLIQPLERKVNEQAATIQQQQAQLTATQTRVGQLESDARTQHLLLVEHSVWDHLALARMSDAGVDLPPIPPLFPAVQPAPTASTTVTVQQSTQPPQV